MPECESCGEQLEPVKERGRERRYRCPGCGACIVEVDDRPVVVRAVVSRGERSETRRISVPGDCKLVVGEPMVLDGGVFRVAKVESAGRSVPRAAPREASCVWLVDSSTVAVKLLVDAGRAGKRRLTTEVPFGTPFETGQVIDIGTMRLKVLAIRAGGGTIRHGSAAAGSLEALVCRVMR